MHVMRSIVRDRCASYQIDSPAAPESTFACLRVCTNMHHAFVANCRAKADKTLGISLDAGNSVGTSPVCWLERTPNLPGVPRLQHQANSANRYTVLVGHK
jgi:hypothetical protein